MANSTQIHIIDNTLTCTFPTNWKIVKCDDWAFYRKQFCKVRDEKGNGICSVDLLALTPQKELWLIEVKDYRQHRRRKSIEPWHEFRNKVFDTLAMLLPASCNAVNTEKIFAAEATQAKTLRIAYVFLQPKKHSKLFPREFELDDICKKLKQYVKAIDAHPIVMDINIKPASLAWTIQ